VTQAVVAMELLPFSSLPLTRGAKAASFGCLWAAVASSLLVSLCLLFLVVFFGSHRRLLWVLLVRLLVCLFGFKAFAFTRFNHF